MAVAGAVVIAAVGGGCQSGGGSEETQFPALPTDAPKLEGVVHGFGDRAARQFDLPALAGESLPGTAEGERGALAGLPGNRTVTVDRGRKSLTIRDDTGASLASVRLENEVISSPSQTPGGGFAVVVQRPGGEDTDRASLVTFSPTGIPVHEAALGDLSGVSTREGAIVLSVSVTGLIAVFPQELGVTSRTEVYNAATGALVRGFAGRAGGAWSPDGTGLLLGRVNPSGGTDVGFAYGAKLAKFKALGGVSGEFIPTRWLPRVLSGA